MQYAVLRGNQDDFEMFSSDADGETDKSPVVSDEQFGQMPEYLQRTNNPALLPIQIAYYTGLRLGEVCGLTWQDIDLEGKYLTVRRSICYNNTRKAMTIGPTKRKKIRNALRKRVDGLEEFHFHQLRHTYTSKLLANGAAPKDVQELSGHSDSNTTMNIYAHAARESKRNSGMLLEVATV